MTIPPPTRVLESRRLPVRESAWGGRPGAGPKIGEEMPFDSGRGWAKLNGHFLLAAFEDGPFLRRRVLRDGVLKRRRMIYIIVSLGGCPLPTGGGDGAGSAPRVHYDTQLLHLLHGSVHPLKPARVRLCTALAAPWHDPPFCV